MKQAVIALVREVLSMARLLVRKLIGLGPCVVLGVLVVSYAQGQAGNEGKTKVTGAELKEWASKDAVYAGINHGNGCAWMVVAFRDGTREQYWNCPVVGSGIFKGTGRVVGDKLCTKYDKIAAGHEQCWELYRVGRNHFEGWRDGRFQLDYYKLK